MNKFQKDLLNGCFTLANCCGERGRYPIGSNDWNEWNNKVGEVSEKLESLISQAVPMKALENAVALAMDQVATGPWNIQEECQRFIDLAESTNTHDCADPSCGMKEDL